MKENVPEILARHADKTVVAGLRDIADELGMPECSADAATMDRLRAIMNAVKEKQQ